MNYEQQFLDALKSIFIGAKVEGESGYINLMKIKASYFEKGVFPQLMKDIDSACKPFEKGFREELFDKLYDFFQHYFSESGSIYFRNTVQHHNIHEKVYTDDRDVMLFWKTHMLYYVKTDRLFNSMDVEVDGEKFFFDVSGMELKRANEKRELTYIFKSFKEGKTTLSVSYSEKGRKTKVDEILKAVKAKGVTLDEETLEKAFRVFEKQSEVDYFINKNARAFLCEQFDLWMYQYLFKGESVFNEIRLQQLQAIKEIAYKIIDFIAQFEDELIRIWNKPKFVLNSNYIITLDKIANSNEALLKTIFKHKGMKDQIAEWQELGIADKKFKTEMVLEKDLVGDPLHLQYQYLPLDTKYFKDLELDILAIFDDLDASINGWLIHSENYQALNTLLPKFREQVKTIYIDPPYNTGDDEFVYQDKFQNSSWLTMIENRLKLSRDLLNHGGSIITSIGREEVFELEQVFDTIFNEANQIGDLIWEKGRKNDAKYFSLGHDYLLVYAKDEQYLRQNNIVWREEKPGAHEILEEYRRLKSLHGNKFGLIEQGIREFYNSLPKTHISLKHKRYNRVDANGLWRDDNMSWPGGDGPRYDVIHPKTKKPCKVPDGGWRFSNLEKFKLYEKNGFIEYREDHNEPPILKRYLNFVSTDFDPDSKRRRNTISDGEEESNVQVMPSVFYKNQQPTVLQLRHIMGKDAFKNPKDPDVIGRLFVYVANKSDLFLDFFAGSGTTAHAIINLNREDGGKRKYILVEMDEHFNTVILPRVKKVAFSDKWKDGIAQEGKGVSHFVKYFELEQYEDTLGKARYEDAPLFAGTQDTYTSYVFLRDLKLLNAVKVDKKKNKVEVDLDKLYDGIDLAETLSCLTGKWVKRIAKNTVEFQDGTTSSLSGPKWEDVKPLIWW
jgi:adenine-specific DNA-methyltransferase